MVSPCTRAPARAPPTNDETVVLRASAPIRACSPPRPVTTTGVGRFERSPITAASRGRRSPRVSAVPSCAQPLRGHTNVPIWAAARPRWWCGATSRPPPAKPGRRRVPPYPTATCAGLLGFCGHNQPHFPDQRLCEPQTAAERAQSHPSSNWAVRALTLIGEGNAGPWCGFLSAWLSTSTTICISHVFLLLSKKSAS